MTDTANRTNVFQINFDNGIRFECQANCAVSVAMKRAGKRATMIGCRGGGCGVCRVQVIEGSYRTEKMSNEHVDEAEARLGYALGCCLFPDSDLLLRAAPK